MNGLIDFINDRINRFVKGSDIINATPATVVSVEDSDWATVQILSNNVVYRLRNLSGTSLIDGQNCLVYYKKYLSQSTSYIGAASLHESGGNIKHLPTNNSLGNKSGTKYKISELKFDCSKITDCFLSFSSSIKGTADNNITLYIYIDGEEQEVTFEQTLTTDNVDVISFYLPIGSLSAGRHILTIKGTGSCNIQGVFAFVYGYDISVPQLVPLYKIAGSSPNIPMLTGTSDIDVASTGESNVSFIAHRKYSDSDDTGMSANVKKANDEIMGDYISVQSYGGVYHDISDLVEWSAIIKISGFSSWSTPNRGYDIINGYENWNMHIFYENFWGEKIYIIPQDLVSSPVIYDNPFGFQAYGDDRLRTTTVPDGYSSIKQWLCNYTVDSHGSSISQGREFGIGVKDGYLYVYLEGYPICKQVYTKPISKLNVGWLDTRSGNDYIAGNGIQTFEIYDSFIFDIPE